MAITTLSMVLTVYVLNLYGISDRPVPPWAKTLVSGYLARIVCMCRRTDAPSLQKDPLHPTVFGNSVGHLLLPSSDFSLQGGAAPPQHDFEKGSGAAQGASSSPVELDTKQREANWGKEWQRLAEIVDRLFFWVFLIGIVVTTLLLFHPLVKSTEMRRGAENVEG